MGTRFMNKMTSNELLATYDNYCNVLRDYERMADDSYGVEKGFYMGEATKTYKVVNTLLNEINRRKANNTLYEGKRNIIAKVWAWAKKRANDEKHRYNIVRKVMSNRFDVYMAEYANHL